ncbi:MAG TPA: hypothetical protein DEA44_15970, partial [Firmicutes bacterium]|nr:hypothetical protein [Bacillota bacterium]
MAMACGKGAILRSLPPMAWIVPVLFPFRYCSRFWSAPAVYGAVWYGCAGVKESKSMQGKIEQIARQRMGAGYNCCQAVLLAADECFELALPPEVLTAGKLFGGGLKSGCICGALTGLVMAAGVLQEKHPHPLADGLA